MGLQVARLSAKGRREGVGHCKAWRGGQAIKGDDSCPVAMELQGVGMVGDRAGGGAGMGLQPLKTQGNQGSCKLYDKCS